VRNLSLATKQKTHKKPKFSSTSQLPTPLLTSPSAFLSSTNDEKVNEERSETWAERVFHRFTKKHITAKEVMCVSFLCGDELGEW
jgi:predicted alpha/beta hydrolase family esterase